MNRICVLKRAAVERRKRQLSEGGGGDERDGLALGNHTLQRPGSHHLPKRRLAAFYKGGPNIPDAVGSAVRRDDLRERGRVRSIRFRVGTEQALRPEGETHMPDDDGVDLDLNVIPGHDLEDGSIVQRC